MGWNHKLTHEQRVELVHRVATYELTDQQAAEEYRIARRSVYYLCHESEAYAALFEQAREEWRKRVREEKLAISSSL